MDSTIKRTFAGSLGTGMSFLFGGTNPSYILEHKVSSQYHKLGEAQEIIVDRIEIGRSSSCEVRFDDNFPTVSRHHAAIIRDGDRFKLVHLSETNSTLLNGHAIKDEWYLQNGDEIQLSVNGPKLGFIIPKQQPQGSTIGLTRRLSLFRNQALKPYRTALIVMGIILLLVAAGVGYNSYQIHKINQDIIRIEWRLDTLSNYTNACVAELDSMINEGILIAEDAKLIADKAKAESFRTYLMQKQDEARLLEVERQAKQTARNQLINELQYARDRRAALAKVKSMESDIENLKNKSVEIHNHVCVRITQVNQTNVYARKIKVYNKR